jgi:PAT family beta-lactamase induction signal transducer AmpG
MNAWRLGMYVSIGLAFLTADASVSWGNIHLLLAAMMAVGIVTTLLVREPDMPPGAPRSLKAAIVEPFTEFFRRDGAVVILMFILLYKLGDNMAGALNVPFILKMGFSKTEYLVIVKGIGMLGMFGGVLLGGAVMIRLGIARSLWVFGVFQAASTAGFALLVIIDHDSRFWAEHRQSVLAAVVCFEFFSTGLGQAAYATYMAVKTNRQFTATQYALLTSLMAVPGALAAMVTGYMAEFLGWSGFYLACALLAVPGMLLLVKLAPWNASNRELDDGGSET